MLWAKILQSRTNKTVILGQSFAFSSGCDLLVSPLLCAPFSQPVPLSKGLGLKELEEGPSFRGGAFALHTEGPKSNLGEERALAEMLSSQR